MKLVIIATDWLAHICWYENLSESEALTILFFSNMSHRIWNNRMLAPCYQRIGRRMDNGIAMLSGIVCCVITINFNTNQVITVQECEGSKMCNRAGDGDGCQIPAE